MSGPNRVVSAVRNALAKLVPAERRDWVEAVWAEASEVPPGRGRASWRAGGLGLIVRAMLTPRRVGIAVLAVLVAVAVGWGAWPGSRYTFATSVDMLDLIGIVVLLVVARRIFGPPGESRIARFLRAGTYIAMVALVASKNIIEQILDVAPRGGVDLRLWLLVSEPGTRNNGWTWLFEILFVLVLAFFVGAILWVTSQRSRVAPATLAIGTAVGVGVGVVLYALGPLGFGGALTTNPWLIGTRMSNNWVVPLAFGLMICAPAVAAFAASRRYSLSGGSAEPGAARSRQIVTAGLLANMIGALFVTVLATGTMAAMIKAAWLRAWLFHGPRQLSGVDLLRHVLRGNSGAMTYAHQITAAADAPTLLAVCIALPVAALVVTGLATLVMTATESTGRRTQAPLRGSRRMWGIASVVAIGGPFALLLFVK